MTIQILLKSHKFGNKRFEFCTEAKKKVHTLSPVLHRPKGSAPQPWIPNLINAFYTFLLPLPSLSPCYSVWSMDEQHQRHLDMQHLRPHPRPTSCEQDPPVSHVPFREVLVETHSDSDGSHIPFLYYGCLVSYFLWFIFQSRLHLPPSPTLFLEFNTCVDILESSPVSPRPLQTFRGC